MRPEKRRAKAIAAFWLRFEIAAPQLAVVSSADDPVYDEVLDHLQAVEPGLYLEFSNSDRPFELIITADGDADLFAAAREVVASAPVVDGWDIRALKPKLGFPERVQWEGQEIDVADLRFASLECDGSDDLGLLIFVPGLADGNIDAAHSAVLRLLDHGLGEERAAAAIQHTELAPLTTGAPSDGTIALVNLERFLDWRSRRGMDAG